MVTNSRARRPAAVDVGGETRERILIAALDAFSSNGFDGAKTREIAAQAGVNLGLIQYHFGGKAKLWRAAVDRAFEELQEGLKDVVGDVVGDSSPTDDRDPVLIRESIRNLIRELIHGYVHFVARNPQFVRLMHEEGKRKGPRMRWLVDRHVNPLYETVSAIMQRAQQYGVLPAGIAPVHFHYIMAGAVSIIFHQAEECKRLTGLDPADASAVEAHARAVEYLFLGSSETEVQQ